MTLRQITDDVEIAQRGSLMGWIGQLWCEDENAHGYFATVSESGDSWGFLLTTCW